MVTRHWHLAVVGILMGVVGCAPASNRAASAGRDISPSRGGGPDVTPDVVPTVEGASPDAEVTVEGLVHDENGKPVADAVVFSCTRDSAATLMLKGYLRAGMQGALEAAADTSTEAPMSCRTLRSDAAGAFSTKVCGAEPSRGGPALFVAAPRRAFRLVRLVKTPVDVLLEPEVPVELGLSCGGEKCEETTIDIAPKPNPPPGERVWFDLPVVKPMAIHGLRPGTWQFHAAHRYHAAGERDVAKEVVLIRGTPVVLPMLLAPTGSKKSIEGAVTLEGGGFRPQSVSVIATCGPSERAATVPLGSGKFVLEDVPRGPCTVHASASSDNTCPALSTRTNVLEGARGIELKVCLAPPRPRRPPRHGE